MSPAMMASKLLRWTELTGPREGFRWREWRAEYAGYCLSWCQAYMRQRESLSTEKLSMHHVRP